MNLTSLTSTGSSRVVLPCGVEVIRKVGLLDPAKPKTMRHTVIIAGQHGCETGPVFALHANGISGLSLHKVQTGVLTIVRIANPHGFAIGDRLDANGKDPNREWTVDSMADAETMQSQVWATIMDPGLPGPLELFVLDLHSSTGSLFERRIVVVDDCGTTRAVELSLKLALADQAAGKPDRDRPWDVLKQWTSADPTDRERHHPAGTLAGWVNSVNGVGLTVEFPTYTYRELSAGYDGPAIGYSGEGWRTMTIGELIHGVMTLFRWAIDSRHR